MTTPPNPRSEPGVEEQPSSSNRELGPGDWLGGKYRVEGVLGEGGMGIVYAATHVDLQRQVAIKVIRSHLSQEPQLVQRLTQEARAVAQIQNDHVVQVLDVGQLDSSDPYIVMERLQGENLLDIVAAEGPLSPSIVVDYVLQACIALAAAHRKGIIHRDLKPENLFLAIQPDGTRLIKVLDFGICKQLRPSADAKKTEPAVVLGSPQYMAPEQLRAQPDIDERADIWALGVVLYELLTGRCPFEASTVPETCALILNRAPNAPSTLRPELPRELDTVVLRCLSQAREARFASVMLLAEALAPLAQSDAQAKLERIARLLGDTASSQQSLNYSRTTPSPQLDTAASARQRKWGWGKAVAGALALLGGVAVASSAFRHVPAASPPAAAAPHASGSTLELPARSFAPTATVDLTVVPEPPARASLPAADPPASKTSDVPEQTPVPASLPTGRRQPPPASDASRATKPTPTPPLAPARSVPGAGPTVTHPARDPFDIDSFGGRR